MLNGLNYDERRMLRLILATLLWDQALSPGAKWVMVETETLESKEKSALRSLVKQGYVERVRSNGMVLLSFTDKGYVAAREAERV